MPKAVIMPKAGITVESCIIGTWEKKVGDQVKVGDILFTYETDKASFECESTEEGTLLEIFFGDGDEVECLLNVCAIGEPGEDCSALRPSSAAAAEAPAVQAPAQVEEKAAPVAQAPVTTATATATDATAVSPRAKKLAERTGVDASAATPTGPNGRVIERDVRNLIDNPATAKAEAKAPVKVEVEQEYTDVKFSGIRRAISKSMSNSLATAAQLTHNTTFDATNILNYRKMLKNSEGDLAGITLGDIVLYAVSRTLLNHPDLNANMLDGENIRLFKHVNLGVAVDTPRGLMVPTIFNADQKSLLEISKEVKQLAKECRDGNISPDKLSGGTFTVSNLGSLGVETFTPVINAPQTGILGVCKSVERVRRGPNGEIEIYPAMGLSLTYDHRAVDGSPASRFQKELGENLENFTVLLAK
ncbi:MAG: 2-oxo acid dehydrogenase subunit E2 [Clostridia bacterium]|nr:2-oxo acid dehydrogenase subunit E2 [Clostridia bacterium]